MSSELLADGGWRVSGRAEPWELIDRVGGEIENGSYETVSGLVCGHLGYVPEAGERLEIGDLSFRVEAADERRVISVVVERRATEPSAEP